MLEVLPVLAVVTLGVVGTFLYLLIADGCMSLPHSIPHASTPITDLQRTSKITIIIIII